MPDEVVLSPEAAAVANEIEAVDREVADIRSRTEAEIGWGLRGGAFALGVPQRDEQHLDARRDELLAHRAELVSRLQRLTGVR